MMTDMTEAQIEAWGRESGFEDGWLRLWVGNFRRFAELARQEERKKTERDVGRLFEQMRAQADAEGWGFVEWMAGYEKLIADIRARGSDK